MTTLPPGGMCPNEPEDPISEESYDSIIAAMDAMIAAADEPHLEGTEATGDGLERERS